jgi:hypothetical protein
MVHAFGAVPASVDARIVAMDASPSGSAADGENRALRNWALLTLPLLAAQRDVLAACKTYIKDENSTLPMQNFALRQLYALMMVFEPARKLRDACSDLESGVGKVYKEALPKFVSGSVALIEAQEAIVGSMIDALTQMKNTSGKSKKDGS